MSNMQTVELRQKDIDLIDNVINGKNWLAAAKAAGFANPTRDAAQILVDTRALAYAYRKTRGRIQLEGSPAAFNLMLRVMNDENRDMKLRIDIAKVLFAAGGFIAPKAPDAPQPDEGEDLKDMTAKELTKFVSQIAGELKRRKEGEIIDVTPQPINQAIDMPW